MLRLTSNCIYRVNRQGQRGKSMTSVQIWAKILLANTPNSLPVHVRVWIPKFIDLFLPSEGATRASQVFIVKDQTSPDRAQDMLKWQNLFNHEKDQLSQPRVYS